LALDAMIGGQADVATVAETPVVFATYGGQKLRIIATMSEEPMKIIANRTAGIAKLEDLKGKRIAVLVGTSADYFLSKVLAASGIATSDVKVTNLNPPDMVTALSRGDIDAYCAWEPHVIKGQQTLGDRAVVFTRNDIYTEMFNIVTSDEFVTKRAPAAAKLLKVLARASRYIEQNPGEAISITSKETNMDSVLLKGLWPEYAFGPALKQRLLDNLTGEIQWAKQAGIVKADAVAPDVRLVIYDKILRDVDAKAVTIAE
jgi:ABC-type nitrate/sulfonate/bicarbonate transport system substrate-binding protein